MNDIQTRLIDSEDIRDKIVQEFFNPKVTRNVITACFSQNPSKFNCKHEITYDKLIKNDKLEPMIVSDFLLSVIDQPSTPESTRIACEDTSWFTEEGFFEEHQKLGNSIDNRVMNNSALLCCYNTTKLNDEQMNKILSSRNYIILQEPFSVYKKNSK
jgi:hypothetical protein